MIGMKTNTGIVRLTIALWAMVMTALSPVVAAEGDGNGTNGEKAMGAETFSVTTLNVDGMPARILFFNANSDGPSSTYTPAISEYLANQGSDFIGVQENFNYNSELDSHLADQYDYDEWSGGIITSKGSLNILNIKFSCDGLKSYWKHGIKLEGYERVAWDAGYGKFDHAWDTFVTKGFRRYELQLESGTQLVVYNMHMDASDMQSDESDQPDREARVVQWRQLRAHILDHLDNRPIIVMGDLNSYYGRDPVKQLFIDSIKATGLATVSDVWIELMDGNDYPELRDDWTRAPGEEGDKILYINPTNANVRLVPVTMTIDTENYNRPDGRRYGDHPPLLATFTIERLNGTLPGDVNADGAVNVGDIMAVVNVMAGQMAGIDKNVADVNADGAVNTGDIMAIINLMTDVRLKTKNKIIIKAAAKR